MKFAFIFGVFFFAPAFPAFAKERAKTLYDGFDKRANQLTAKDDEFVNQVMRPKMRACGEQEHQVGEKFFYVSSVVETYYWKAVLLRAQLISGVNRGGQPCEGEISVATLREWASLGCEEIKDQVVSFCEWPRAEDESSEEDNTLKRDIRFLDGPPKDKTNKPAPPSVEL